MRAQIKSFNHAVENDHLDYDADIERPLHTLKQERQAGESFLTQDKGLLSPILTLPPEITLEIFRHCLDKGWPPLNRPSYSFLDPGAAPIPWILSAVCRRWRGILRESPSYWASFNVGWRRPFLQDALQLSQHAPLYFTIDIFHSSICIQALVKHATRWRSIHLSGTKNAFLSLGHLGHLPTLKTLSVSLKAIWNTPRNQYSDDDKTIDITSTLSPFSDCPQLDELLILTEGDHRCNQNNLDAVSLSIPWANLSKLTVSFGASSSPILRSLLLACTNLCQLIVRGTGRVGEPLDVNHLILPKPLLIHSTISSLALENFPLYLIQHTAYSALTHLSVANTPPQEIIPFLSRYHHRVTHFELLLEDAYPKHTKDWDPVLVLLPDIIHLTVHLALSPMPVWTAFSNSLTVRLPNLRTLTIDSHSSLLKFSENWDIIPLIASGRLDGKLQVLEISCKRIKDWVGLRYLPALHALDLDSPDLSGAVSRIIEESATMKALRVFKEEGLEVIINGKPLCDRRG